MFPQVLACAVLALAVAASANAASPKGWFLAGSHPNDYTVAVERSNAQSGEACASLASNADGSKGFGTLMQKSEPGAFAGKRVRFTAHVRSADVSDWAGLWFRVDGRGTGSLAFDNMQDRPIEGDSNWKPYSIVLDVPESATALAFGVLLQGGGTVWIDNASIEIVSRSVPTTGAPAPRDPAVPSNLGFEQ